MLREVSTSNNDKNVSKFEMIYILKFNRIIILILLICLHVASGFSQDTKWNSLSKYELPNAIAKSLSTQFSDVKSIDDLTVSVTDNTDFTVFKHHYRYYLVNASIDEVWDKYLDFNLKSAWSGKAINYGFAYSRESNEIFTSDNDVVLKPKVGLGFFLELDIVKVFKMPVAFEVSCIDAVNKIIQFTYLKRNKTNGRQTIIFKRYTKNKTLILHHTYFKSDKKLRDRYFYAPIHKSIIDQFHNIVLKEVATFKTVSRRMMKNKFRPFKIDLFSEQKKLEIKKD